MKRKTPTYLRNRARHKARQGARRRARFAAWKAGLKCERCGEDHPACIDLHHRDPRDKDFSLSDMAEKYGWARMLAEIAKCEVLCANCHRKEHAQLAADGAIDRAIERVRASPQLSLLSLLEDD